MMNQSDQSQRGLDAALYLIPVTLGATPVEQVLPNYNREVILQIRNFIVEDVRSARRFLKSVDRSIDIDSLTFYPMGKHADETLFSTYLEPLRHGESVGVISEAGCPAVADPGAVVVALAHREKMRVVPLVGPSSIILAVMASGMNGQNFAFLGYLPIDKGARASKVRQMESRARSEKQTQVFIETPYRNRQLFDELLATLHPSTRLCIAAGLTCPDEYVRTLTVRQWHAESLPDLRKTPAIFLIYC